MRHHSRAHYRGQYTALLSPACLISRCWFDLSCLSCLPQHPRSLCLVAARSLRPLGTRGRAVPPSRCSTTRQPAPSRWCRAATVRSCCGQPGHRELAGSWDYSPLNPLPNAAGDNLLIRNATSAAVVAADYPAHAGGAAEGAAADRLAVFYPRYDGLGFGYSVVTLSSSPTAPLQVNLSQSIRPDLELTQQQLAAASFGKELSLLYFDIDDLRVKQLLHGPHTTISRSALGVAAEPR